MRALLPLLLLLTPAAYAQDRSNQFSVGADLGPNFAAPWASTQLRNLAGTGTRLSAFARYNYNSENSGFELSLNRLSFSRTDTDSLSVLIAYFYRFNSDSKWHPVASLGLGHEWSKHYFSQGSYSAPIFRLRLGLEYEWKKNIDLALHLDQFSVFRDQPQDPDMHGFTPSLSIAYYFGEPRPSAPAAQTADADGDKVPDAQDRCPNTPAGMPVNEYGCAKTQSFEMNMGIAFFEEDTILPANAPEKLSPLVDILRKHPELRTEIRGHVIDSGKPEKDQALSQTRANAVMDYLIQEAKIEKSRVSAVGLGATRPVAKDSSAAQTARNARIIVRVSE